MTAPICSSAAQMQLHTIWFREQLNIVVMWQIDCKNMAVKFIQGSHWRSRELYLGLKVAPFHPTNAVPLCLPSNLPTAKCENQVQKEDPIIHVH